MSASSCGGPSIDPNCADPAFRAANPDLCENFTELILEPEYMRVESGKTVTYKVILRANAKEIELTKGLTWSIDNPGVATINEDGAATGVMSGIATVSVTWQDLSAQAQLEVVGDCQETKQNFLILIDDSKSMGQAFSPAYATKLSFCKSVAGDFSNTINFSKDEVAVFKFGDAATKRIDWTTDAVAARAAIAGIGQSSEKTNLKAALQSAIDYFQASGVTGVRVIILFTDGEITGDDPTDTAHEFKTSGGVLTIVGTRCWGEHFVLLEQLASAGFFLSAYAATQFNILSNLSGLKSFLCSGDCNPEPGTAPMAQLNYYDWINWNASRVMRDSDGNEISEFFPGDPSDTLDEAGHWSGYPDLIGLGLWDVRPGNGLYVDLQGTQAFAGQDFGFGRLTSKNDYDLAAGSQYKLTISIGGTSSANNPGEWKVKIRVGNELTQIVTVNNGHDPLAVQTFTWTQATNFSGPIIIEQLSRPAGGHPNVGCSIDEVTLEDLTTPATLLYDNFDTENPTTIDPSGSYYGCLETSPGTQTADPTPPTPTLVE